MIALWVLAGAVSGAAAAGNPTVAEEPPAIHHTVRVGPTTFQASGPHGSCDGCWFPTGTSSGTGGRIDYVFQLGTGPCRWHNIAALELTYGTSRFPWHTNDDTWNGKSYGPTSGTAISNGLMVAGFLGTGLRIDAHPQAEQSFLFELDGTIGASSTPHFGLLGAHLAVGFRFNRQWELMLSAEGDVLSCGQVSASLLIGRTF